MLDGCELFAITDLYHDLSRRMQQKYRIKKVYDYHKDLLEDQEIDAVIVTLPRKLTANVCLEALKAKKHVITEKPLALNLDMAKKLKNNALKNNKNILVGYMKKNDAGVKAFSELITKKLKSKLILIPANFYGKFLL